MKWDNGAAACLNKQHNAVFRTIISFTTKVDDILQKKRVIWCSTMKSNYVYNLLNACLVQL